MGCPTEVDLLATVDPSMPDDALLLAASWEKRCQGVAQRLGGYQARAVVMTIYDGESPLREKNIRDLRGSLPRAGRLVEVPAKHADPLQHVRDVVGLLSELGSDGSPRLTVDVTTFTRKHLLELLQGLDLAGMLARCQFLHTEPGDFRTSDNESISHGVSSIRVLETLAGRNNPAHDKTLVLFLGYEGRRALALWDDLDPHVTIPVIPHPPYRPEWAGRTEEQNRYLLSCIPRELVRHSHALDPEATQRLLEQLIPDLPPEVEANDYLIAPLGTKAQTLGVYRFWRRRPGLASVVYATPGEYRQGQATFGCGRMWLIDKSDTWGSHGY